MWMLHMLLFSITGVGGACRGATLRVVDEEAALEDSVHVGEAESAREGVAVGCGHWKTPGEG